MTLVVRDHDVLTTTQHGRYRFVPLRTAPDAPS
jgi:protein-L-isoaspartate(D-aspartate) O-methyltransferase